MALRPVLKRVSVAFKADATVRDKLDYWVSMERCLPGSMHLVPVFDEHGVIIDFRCAVASPAVARLLNDISGEAVGRLLSTLLATQDNGAELLLAYILAARSGGPLHIFSVSHEGERIQHHLTLAPRFAIEAELQNLSDVERARGAFARLKSVVSGPASPRG